jgi:HK97 family phage major capsid protein
VLEAKKLAAYLGGVPDELVEDAAAFEVFARTAIPMGLAWAEDQAFIAGSGVGQPQGILNASCAVNVTRTSGGSLSLQADVTNMVTRMLPQSMKDFIWLCSPDKIGPLLNMYLLVGTLPSSSAVAPSAWLTGSATDGWTLLGRPLFVTEHVPALGTRGDLIAVDPRFYVIQDRQQMTIDTSAVGQKFAIDQTEFRVISRLDGRMWPQSPVTPQNASATVSPVVILN